MPLEMFPELTRQRRLEIQEKMYNALSDKSEDNFDEKTLSFLSAVNRYVENSWLLSDKQLKWLKDIYERTIS